MKGDFATPVWRKAMKDGAGQTAALLSFPVDREGAKKWRAAYP
jgi:hypothetical protein